MGLLRYSEGELRNLLGRAVKIHWPGEDLVILTECLAEPSPRDPSLTPEPAALADSSLGWGTSPAFLAATHSRLIYQERTTQAVLLKAIATILGTMAVAILFFGSGLGGFAAIGLTGLAIWVVAKVAELITVGRTSIEFHRIEMVDRLAQRIHGTVRSGAAYHLRVPDPSDFGMIASLVNGFGAAA
jgi:hypothetical protein